MCKRIITWGIYVLIAFFFLAVCEPQENAVAMASATGTIAYVVPDDTTGDQIWLIQPDGSNDHQIYSTGLKDPDALHGISAVAWRPDGGELVFASDHELICSWFASDVYAISSDGSGYRRVTNAPACAALANYPKGTVVMSLAGADSSYQVYVQGAPSVKSVSSGGGIVTFNNVADLGDNGQPVVVINGQYRFTTDAFVHVQAGQTADAGIVSLTSGRNGKLGAYGPTWNRDGSRIGYTFGCATLYGITDQPPAGNWGQSLFDSSQVSPCMLSWGPTASTANQIVYYNNTLNPGIYLTTEGSDEGTLLVPNSVENGNNVFQIHYLPDGSGFIYSIIDNFIYSANLYRYDFASGTVTKLTSYTNQFARDFAISPDGQTIVYELATFDFLNTWGGASDLWTMGIDGSDPQLFKTGAAHPSWSLTTPYVPSGPTQPPGAPQPPGTTQPAFKLYLPLIVR